MEDQVDVIQNVATPEKKGFVKNHFEKLQLSAFNLFLTVIISIIVMFIVCLVVFFANLKGEEQVMVPNIVGKDLPQALLEMQEKELYPKIQLRYTDNPDDAGKILDQNPEPGAIVKAGRRINMTVSRGVIIDHVENYVGETLDDVKIKLQTMFTGSSRPLIVLDEPSFKADKAPNGTIIAQEPVEGTPISTPVTVKLIVSRGADYETTKIPNLKGLSIEKALQLMASTKLIFDFESHIALEGERAGTVTNQKELDSQYAKVYSHISLDLALPAEFGEKDKVSGLFTTKLTKYPYPVSMTLTASKDGKKSKVVELKHIGGNVTIPYVVDHQTELILSVAGKNVATYFVE